MREFTTCFSGLRDCLPLHLSWVQYSVLFGPSAWFPFKFCLYYFFKIKFGLWSVAGNGFSITAYQLCKPPQAGSLRRPRGGGVKLTRLLRHLCLLLLANHFFFRERPHPLMEAVLEKPGKQDSEAKNVDLLPKWLTRVRHFT